MAASMLPGRRSSRTVLRALAPRDVQGVAGLPDDSPVPHAGAERCTSFPTPARRPARRPAPRGSRRRRPTTGTRPRRRRGASPDAPVLSVVEGAQEPPALQLGPPVDRLPELVVDLHRERPRAVVESQVRGGEVERSSAAWIFSIVSDSFPLMPLRTGELFTITLTISQSTPASRAGHHRGVSDSARGRLLVATPTLYDPNFFRSVVLVLEHGEDGALGVVLNRPSETAVGETLPDWNRLASDPGVVFVGGPVSPDAAIGVARAGISDQTEGSALLFGSLGTVDLGRYPVELPLRRPEPAGLRRVRRLDGGSARRRARRRRLVRRRRRPRRRVHRRAGPPVGLGPAPPGRPPGHVRHRSPASLAELMARTVVDGMNSTIGSRPDGWWRDVTRRRGGC